MFKKVFIKSFLKPEFKFLSGKGYSNLFILVFILTISMLAIGLGNGVVEYMRKKMSSPFISFVNVKIPHGKISLNLDNETLNKRFSSQYNLDMDYKEYFNITSDPKVEFRDYCVVINPLNGLDAQPLIRMSLHDDPLLLFMKDRGDLPPNFSFRDAKNGEMGCIVSRKFLKELKYDEQSLSYLFLRRNISGEYQSFPIPVHAIVDELPDGVGVICGNAAFNIIQNDIALYKECDNEDNFIFIPDVLNTILPTVDVSETYAKYMSKTVNGKLFRVPHDQSKKYYALQNKGVVVFNDYLGLVNLTGVPEDWNKEQLPVSFNPSKMDSIEVFSHFLEKQFGLEVDLTVIEDKKNFNLFNKVSKLLSFSLIFFSIFSMVLFITNLIVNHISKNRKNLGTLKAFGMSNQSIVLVYSSISLALILIAFVVGLLVSTFVGNVTVSMFAEIFGMTSNSELSFINYTPLTLIIYFVVIPFILLVVKLFGSLHGNTPGDLIYER